jgi:hypothetical protein
MCDAVQDETYKVDGVPVSNFLLPLYFTPDAEEGGRNDFLGRLYKGKPLTSFGINPGGYIGFYNPQSGQHETYALKGDKRARARMAIKGKAQMTRRSMRYRAGTSYPEQIRKLARRAQPRRARPAMARAAANASRAVEMIAQAPKRLGLGVD